MEKTYTIIPSDNNEIYSYITSITINIPEYCKSRGLTSISTENDINFVLFTDNFSDIKELKEDILEYLASIHEVLLEDDVDGNITLSNLFYVSYPFVTATLTLMSDELSSSVTLGTKKVSDWWKDPKYSEYRNYYVIGIDQEAKNIVIQLENREETK